MEIKEEARDNLGNKKRGSGDHYYNSLLVIDRNRQSHIAERGHILTKKEGRAARGSAKRDANCVSKGMTIFTQGRDLLEEKIFLLGLRTDTEMAARKEEGKKGWRREKEEDGVCGMQTWKTIFSH